MKRLYNFLMYSNRYKHMLYAIPCGLLLTILFVLGIATGMEYKDKLYGRSFDWIDWWCTIIGGIIGQLLQLLIIYYLI